MLFLQESIVDDDAPDQKQITAMLSCPAVPVKRKRARKQRKLKSLRIVIDKFVAGQQQMKEKYL